MGPRTYRGCRSPGLDTILAMDQSRRATLGRIGVLLVALGVLAAAAWPWSYWRADAVLISVGHHWLIGPAIYSGSLVFVSRSAPLGQTGWRWFNEKPEKSFSAHSLLNFVYLPILPRGLALGVPLWLCSALFWFWGISIMRRSRQPAEGFCPACGYDLRATLDRCPECGAIPH
jgi:hypothetical protein